MSVNKEEVLSIRPEVILCPFLFCAESWPSPDCTVPSVNMGGLSETHCLSTLCQITF